MMFVNELRQRCADASNSSKPGSSKNGKGLCQTDPTTLGIVFMAFLCAVLPLEIPQLTFAIIGAVLYALLQKPGQMKPKKQRISVAAEASSPKVMTRTGKPQAAAAQNNRTKQLSQSKENNQASAPEPTPDIREVSIQPVVAPVFKSGGWEGEVQELLLQIKATPESERTTKQLTQIVRHVLQSIFPEIDVQGFAHGNLMLGKAFGVAVPEVDIVASVSPQILQRRLHRDSAAQVDVRKLYKTAIRACTDKLVAEGGFKFRRSAFRGQEPKVTLVAPASLGLSSATIAIDFSINAVTPLYNSALLTECGKMDSRAKELVLMVKRWAKDRGICHASKGHFSPYVWSLITIYFLQVGVSDEAPLLPPLDQFKMASGLLKEKKAEADSREWTQNTDTKMSVAQLFKEFVHFFDTQFDWGKEAVSICSGRRAPPGADVPLHVIAPDSNSATSQVGPTIEDPFHNAQNLGDGMNHVSLARLKEELSRAEALCVRGASLSELLEPWAPPLSEPMENDEQTELMVEPVQQAMAKKATAKKPLEVSVKGELSQDWRRDAMQAQASTTAPISTPPWRRPRVV